MSGDTTVELVDDHLLGLESDGSSDLDGELLRALDSKQQKYYWRDSLKYIVPFGVILIGILFTFGYLLGSANAAAEIDPIRRFGASNSPQIDDENGSVFERGNRMDLVKKVEELEQELKKDRQDKEKILEELTKEAKAKNEVTRELIDMRSKWTQLETSMNTISVEQQRQKQGQTIQQNTQQISDRLEESRDIVAKRFEEMEKRWTQMQRKVDEVYDEESHIKATISEIEDHHYVSSESSSPSDTHTTKTPQNLNKFNINEFLESVRETRTALENYWGGDTALKGFLYLRPGDKRYDDGVDFVAEKMARALVWGGSFTVGAMGSSVTAGHDNCNYDSYERQMERFLKPLFVKANIKFQVRNAGEGGSCGDSFENQVWCVRHMLGDDIDVAHYSWTYFEHGPEVKKFHEMWIRWVLMMDNAPVPQFFNTGGANGDTDCGNKLGDGALFEAYGKYGVNILCLENGLKKIGYPGKKWGAIGDGIHNTTREGDIEGISESRKKSLGVTFRNWHPGPLGFQAVADGFSYHYLHALLIACDKIIQFQTQNANDATKLQQRWKKSGSALSIDDLPPPKYCDSDICNLQEPPGCTNWEIPTYGRGQIKVMDPDDDFNPYKAQYKPSDKGWKKYTAEKRNLIPKNERNMEGCEHLDVCAGLIGNKESGLLTLRLPRMEIGRIILCSPDGKQAADSLVSDLEISLEETPLTNFQKIYGKCIMAQKEWTGTVSDSKGHIHIGVRVKEGKEVRLSHVIAV